MAKARGLSKKAAVQAPKKVSKDRVIKGRASIKNARKEAEEEIEEDAEDQEWEVERILAVKKMWKNLYARVAWVDYAEDRKWYLISNFKTSPHLLIEFYLDNPDAAGPPKQLNAWHEAWEAGEVDYEHLNSSRPMDARTRAKFYQPEEEDQEDEEDQDDEEDEEDEEDEAENIHQSKPKNKSR